MIDHQPIWSAQRRCRRSPAGRGRGRTRGRRPTATILRLDSVVADPEAEAVELGAAQRVLRGTLRATGSSWEERVPAVAPDRVLALPWIAVGLVATGVHDLEVVDVVVAFVEVAVAVMVVAVPDVERCKLRSDLGVGPACGLLVRYPLVHRVLDEEPGVRADAAPQKPLLRPYRASL